MQSLSDLPITQAQAPTPNVLADAESAIAKGLAAVDYESKAQVSPGTRMMGLRCMLYLLHMICQFSDTAGTVQAYRTWLGFYKGFCKTCGWDNAGVVAAANHYAQVLGMVACPLRVEGA